MSVHFPGGARVFSWTTPRVPRGVRGNFLGTSSRCRDPRTYVDAYVTMLVSHVHVAKLLQLREASRDDPPKIEGTQLPLPRRFGGKARAESVRTMAPTWLPLRLGKSGCSRTSTRDPPHGTRRGVEKRIQLRWPDATASPGPRGGLEGTQWRGLVHPSRGWRSVLCPCRSWWEEHEAGTMDGKHEDFLNGIYFNWIER